jgi:hypothetical protein
MSLVKQVLDCLRWSRTIGAKLLRVAPGYTLLVVVLTLVSQVSMILAFFLPLKVVILLGTERIPRYFPASWQSFDHHSLVISLAIAAGGFYVLNIICEKLVAVYADKGGERLLLSSRKINLFADQAAMTKGAYLRYVSALAGLIFTFLAFLFISLLYGKLAALVSFFMLGVFAVFTLFYGRSEWVRILLDVKLTATVSMLSSVGFLLAFAFMVYDFLMGAVLSMTVAIVCLLLVRQLMVRVSGCVMALAALYPQRIKINALFFHDQQIVAEKVSFEDQKFWELFEVDARKKWVADILRELTDLDFKTLQCHWRETGVGNVILLDVEAEGSNGEALERFLVKLFHTNRQSLATHESSLLLESEPGSIPALPLLGISSVGKYCCHVFSLSGESRIAKNKFKNRRRDAVLHILSYEPAEALVERYCRSKQLLWQRLDESMIGRLEMINSNPLYSSPLESFRGFFDSIVKRIQSLPVYVINPDIKPETLLLPLEGNAVILHWGRWSIEPIGAGWPVKESELKSLAKNVKQAALIRPSLASISLMDIRLAALIFNFESLYHRQHFIKALELLPEILRCVDTPLEEKTIESV